MLVACPFATMHEGTRIVPRMNVLPGTVLAIGIPVATFFLADASVLVNALGVLPVLLVVLLVCTSYFFLLRTFLTEPGFQMPSGEFDFDEDEGEGDEGDIEGDDGGGGSADERRVEGKDAKGGSGGSESGDGFDAEKKKEEDKEEEEKKEKKKKKKKKKPDDWCDICKVRRGKRAKVCARGYAASSSLLYSPVFCPAHATPSR